MPYWRLRDDVRTKETILVDSKQDMLLLDILKELRKMARDLRLMNQRMRALGDDEVPGALTDGEDEEEKSGADGSGAKDADSGD